jgi:guanine deaminase
MAERRSVPASQRLRESREAFMRRAIELARRGSLEWGAGGPFGAVVVRDGQIVGEGWNEVLRRRDPTCHAEMQAIRAAAKRLRRFDLSGCEIFTTGEPCPMCAGAIHWARLDRVWYAASAADLARHGGFDDRAFHREIAKPPSRRSLPHRRLLRSEAVEVCKAYVAAGGARY